MDTLTWLCKWFSDNCNEDWEHNNTISITSLDNPGWHFKADLTDTDYEGRALSLEVRNTENDWYDIACDGQTFNAYGDASKLPILIEQFKNFVEQAS